MTELIHAFQIPLLPLLSMNYTMSAVHPSPLLHLDLRLHSLESQILGFSATFGTATSTKDITVEKSVTRQIRDIQDELERCLGGNGNEPLKRLVAGYETYFPLLSLPGSEGDTATDVLPDSTKLTMVLEAGEDVIQAERGLREIEILRARGVEGSGELGVVLEARQEVIGLGEDSNKRSQELDQARREVGSLLSRYNEFTNTASEMFLDLHHRIEDLEEGVARLERAKRKEIAGRF